MEDNNTMEDSNSRNSTDCSDGRDLKVRVPPATEGTPETTITSVTVRTLAKACTISTAGTPETSMMQKKQVSL
jgi:hypothetical protein